MPVILVDEHHSAIPIERQFAIVGRPDQKMLPLYQTSLTLGEDVAFLKELLESLRVKCIDIAPLRSTSSARHFAGSHRLHRTARGVNREWT
ncbi:hypothetical protein ACLK1T_10750 [Escherichia coli]